MKQMLVTSQNRSAQNLQQQNMQWRDHATSELRPTHVNAAPAPVTPMNGLSDPWRKSALAAGLAADNDNAARQGRDVTPGPGARDRATSLASASPGGGNKSIPGGPCYAASHGVCDGALRNPPCTRCKGTGPQPPLDELDTLKRDRWEGGMDKLGKQVPYLRTDAQIEAARANVEANKHLYNAPKGGKGSGKGKKGPLICHYCQGEGHRIAECPVKLNGDPKGWGPHPGEQVAWSATPGKGGPGQTRRAWSANPGRGGPKGWGEPKSVDKPCPNFMKGKCAWGDDCIFQHKE